MSRPTRARGLKLDITVEFFVILKSRPTRARGLKPLKPAGKMLAKICRAPRGRVD